MNENISPGTPLTFAGGKTMKNRFMLAPLTNLQSNADGTLSEEELQWLAMRAEGQFGMVMTCATYVQQVGKCWPGQLGIASDKHLPGHQRLAAAIQEAGSLAIIQLHHGGMRSPAGLIGQNAVGPSDLEEGPTRGLILEEVQTLRDDFIAAAVRAHQAGYDGVEVHGAHGYILTQFLSKEYNHREDQYGGRLENRSRLLVEIIDGIRAACSPDFILGVRLSPERFGMEITEIKALSQQLIDCGKVDFLDLSLWDVFKPSEVNEQSLMEYFADLDRKNVALTVAGKITGGKEVREVLNSGMDFVTIGKSAILHHDFPVRVMSESDFRPTELPVSPAYLKKEGVSANFVEYLRGRPGFVR